MNSNKQTAVEFIIESVMDRGIYTKEMLKEFEQAKEMEKQQIIDANRDGVDMVCENKEFITGEQYYNETFNNK